MPCGERLANSAFISIIDPVHVEVSSPQQGRKMKKESLRRLVLPVPICECSEQIDIIIVVILESNFLPFAQGLFQELCLSTHHNSRTKYSRPHMCLNLS